MPSGDKSSYTDKQKRQADHIEQGYEERGVPDAEAERRAWATVNKEAGGGKLSGSGRGKEANYAALSKGRHTGGIPSASRSEEQRSGSSKTATTRKRNTAKP